MRLTAITSVLLCYSNCRRHSILLITTFIETRFGMGGDALKWFQSYLSGRSQTFQVGVEQSGPYTVTCSVPHGSLPGPQECIANTEYLSWCIERHGVQHYIYSDDIQLIASSKISDIPVLISQIQRCVSSAFAWCSARRLQPNPSKTEVIWFGTSTSLAKLRDTDVSLQFEADRISVSGWTASCQ